MQAMTNYRFTPTDTPLQPENKKPDTARLKRKKQLEEVWKRRAIIMRRRRRKSPSM